SLATCCRIRAPEATSTWQLNAAFQKLRDDEGTYFRCAVGERAGQVVVRLHRQPGPSSADSRTFKAHGEIRADARVPVDDPAQCHARDPEPGCGLGDGGSQLGEHVLADDLAWMRWCLHHGSLLSV